MEFKIYISLKEGVLDPEGKAINSSLVNLGFNEVQDIKTGKYIIIKLNENNKSRARKKISKMCELLLTNTIIEDYVIEEILN
tara:strand:+ start:272 stop:517 length:246 start_codon:yes stop_codon:yes gene_type:complete